MLLTQNFFSRIYYFLALLILVIAGGTCGFKLVEGWSWTDSFYMTIITISTVGFGEVHNLSFYGKIFTSILIISSFGTFGFAITSITTYVVGGDYRLYLNEYKTNKAIKKMEKHVIICGLGRVGRQVAEDLIARKMPIVIIENNPQVINDFKDREGYVIIDGDATQDEKLLQARIHESRGIITCMPKDADNLYVVLASREMSKEITIITRASTTQAVSKLKIAGANNVITPDAVGGSHMATLISNPDVMEFLDIIRIQGSQGPNIESISFNELPEAFQNKTIGQLSGNKVTGVTIIGFKSPDGEYIINPDDNIEVEANSKLFVLGNPDQIRSFVETYGLEH